MSLGYQVSITTFVRARFSVALGTDVRTGQSWYDPAKTRVRSYDVSVEVERGTSTSGELDEARLEKGPFTAETYSISLEKQYIVLEV